MFAATGRWAYEKLNFFATKGYLKIQMFGSKDKLNFRAATNQPA